MPSKSCSAARRVDRAVAGDRVGARPLVGDQPPLAARVGVVDPGVGVLGDVGGDPVAHVLGERLVEPQVVPPRRGDDVAEPLVRHLVRERRGARDPHAAGDPAGEDQRVAEGHAARVLHRAGVELRHERLVVVAERVADAEQPVELVEALPGHREQLVGVRVERPSRGWRARDSPSGMPSCSSRIRWYGPATRVTKYVDSGWVALELPHARLRAASPGALPMTVQSAGARDVERVRRLQVGLVEAREDRGRGVHERHAVDVVPAVGRVDAAVQPLAVVAERHHGVDDQLVVARDGVDRQPAAVEQVRVERRGR